MINALLINDIQIVFKITANKRFSVNIRFICTKYVRRPQNVIQRYNEVLTCFLCWLGRTKYSSSSCIICKEINTSKQVVIIGYILAIIAGAESGLLPLT